MGNCPDAVKRLTERFDQQSDQVRSPDYNETQLRIDFVNPLFAVLGWDIDNRQGFAEQYREVVHEDRVKVAGQTKAPDYSFRVGGARKFFLEAKKPFVNLKVAWEPAYQLRRYGWSAKLAISLLTDFEELAIYDCRITPKQFDKPATARREYINYREYPERWDFIVKNTVGKLLEGKTPKDAAKLKVLDPACGSGSFLIGAYQFLLDWHLAQYTAADPQKLATGKSAVLRPGLSGDWRLTIAERKRIRLDNIHGVDLDASAVEVTKLNLLLKCLEGETSQTLGFQQRMWHERALPDLGHNILCGNSLIGTDIMATDGWKEMSDEEKRRINPFDYKLAFPKAFKQGGFDAVIGNPPYLNIDDTWGKGDYRLQAIKAAFPEVHTDKTDLLFYFLAAATQWSRGQIGFIVSRAFLEAYKAEKLRVFLSSRLQIDKLIDFRNFQVFPGVGITTAILLAHGPATTAPTEGYALLNEAATVNPLLQLEDPSAFLHAQLRILPGSPAIWSIVDKRRSELNAKIDATGVPVGQLLLIGQGMQTGRNDVFGERTLAEIKKWGLPAGTFFRRAVNSDIQRYRVTGSEEYVIYTEAFPSLNDMPPGLRSHLTVNAQALKGRAAYQRGNCEWWRFTWPLHKEHYNRPRLLCPYLARSNRFAIDERNEYLGLTDTIALFDNGQSESLRYFLGLLNSRLLTFRFLTIGKLKSGGIIEYFWNSVSKLPIPRIDWSNPKQKQVHDRFVELVDAMLSLHARLPDELLPQHRDQIQREIEATDRQIDQLVYELYGLTDDEIRIVEEATVCWFSLNWRPSARAERTLGSDDCVLGRHRGMLKMIGGV